MKKILYLVLVTAMVINLISCDEIVNTQLNTVDATIVKVAAINRPRPRHYKMLLEYQQVTTWVDISKGEYRQYKKDKSTIKAHLITTSYESGNVKQYLQVAE